MLKKTKIAFSTMGFAIVIVIIVGLGMIISAPMLAGKYKDKDPDNQQLENSMYDKESDFNREERVEKERLEAERRNIELAESRPATNNINPQAMEEISRQMRNMEGNFNDRLNRVEQQSASSSSITNKYVCSIEGYVDEAGNMVAISSGNGREIAEKHRKFVFVCEYKN